MMFLRTIAYRKRGVASVVKEFLSRQSAISAFKKAGKLRLWKSSTVIEPSTVVSRNVGKLDSQDANSRLLDFDRLNTLAAHHCAVNYVQEDSLCPGNWEVVDLIGGRVISFAPTLRLAVEKALELLEGVPA